MIKTKNLQAGDCLIAPPNNKDPRFRKTVILLADHADTQGSMGIVLNRPSEHRVGALVDGLADNIKDHQLYLSLIHI
jgi:putative transcriptional regulator